MGRSETLRYYQLGAGLVSMILVVVFGPRMDGPRVIGGITFTTKTGGPGLTNLGFLLLLVLPVVSYVVVGLAGRVVLRRRRNSS